MQSIKGYKEIKNGGKLGRGNGILLEKVLVTLIYALED